MSEVYRESDRRGAAGAQWGWPRRTGVPGWRSFEADQERWFLWLPVLFGVGIWLYFGLTREPGWSVVLLGLVGAIVFRGLVREGLALLVVSSVLLAVVAGFTAAKVRTQLVEQTMLGKRLAGAAVTGVIERVEPLVGGAQRVTLRVAAIARQDTVGVPDRVRLRLAKADTRLAPGMRVTVKADLSPPPVPSYPGGYDFARASYFLGLGAVGRATGPIVVLAERDQVGVWLMLRQSLAQFRQEIGRRIRSSLPGESGAIANALITGERGAIPADTNAAFRDSGLAHILAISGLHMTIMAGFVFVACRFMFAAIPLVALRYPTRKWAAVLAAVAALAYLLISGASHATLRAWLMMSIMFLAVLLDRPAISMRNVALAALAILVVVPEGLFDVGFQMSFAAVIGLVAAYEAVRERAARRAAEGRGRWRGGAAGIVLFFGGILLVTVVASAAIAPIAAYHFHVSQQYAVIANLISVPIVNFIIMPMALVALIAMPFGLEYWPLWLMGEGITWMTACARWVSSLQGAVVKIPAMPTSSFAMMVVGGLWFMLWRQRWRWLGLVVVAGGIVLVPTYRHPDVLIGRGGALVAVRGEDGRLSAIGQPNHRYELGRWLENDGDSRDVATVLAGQAFRCDPAGCVARVKGRSISVARHPAALRDDCTASDVLVIAVETVMSCGERGLIVDRAAVTKNGAHALFLGETIEIETVAGKRGQRPWTGGMEQQ